MKATYALRFTTAKNLPTVSLLKPTCNFWSLYPLILSLSILSSLFKTCSYFPFSSILPTGLPPPLFLYIPCQHLQPHLPLSSVSFKGLFFFFSFILLKVLPTTGNLYQPQAKNQLETTYVSNIYKNTLMSKSPARGRLNLHTFPADIQLFWK